MIGKKTGKTLRFEDKGIAYNYGITPRFITEHTKNKMNVFCDELANFMRSYNKKVGKGISKSELQRYTFAKFHKKFRDTYGYLMRKRY